MVDNTKLHALISSLDFYFGVKLALERGLFEIDDEGETIAQISARIKLSLPQTGALVSAGLYLEVLKQEGDIVLLTEAGKKYLKDDSPFSMADIIRMMPVNYELFEAGFKGNYPDIFTQDMAYLMVGMMHKKSAGLAAHWPTQIDLSDAKTLLDVGAGSGVHVIEACKRFESLRGIALDLPPVCPMTDIFIGQYDMSKQITTFPCDMFTASWPDVDAIVMCDVVHDWPDEKARVLLSKAHATLPSGGRLILLEVLLNEDKAGPFVAVGFNLAVLKMLPEGGQRTGKEIEALLHEAGFMKVSMTPTFSGATLIVATK